MIAKTLKLMPAALLLTCASLAAQSPPDGEFSGSGSWVSQDGSRGTYRVEVTIEDGRMESTYHWGEGRTERWTLRIAPQNATSFDLLDDSGSAVGSGSCMEDQCLYRAELPGADIEETLRLEGGRLHRFGTKTVAGGRMRIVWRETLDLH